MLEREEIYQRVWGYTMAHGDRSVDVFVRKLRSKLQQVSPDWTYIHTHFGVGYRFAAELVMEAEIAAAVAAARPCRPRPSPGRAVRRGGAAPRSADERKPGARVRLTRALTARVADRRAGGSTSL